jgi:natural product biosynthesis luciferase-like monooxygenase protein
VNCYLVGGESLLIQCAELLLSRGHRILGIVSSAPLICDWASERGIGHQPLTGNLATSLAAEPFDYLFSVTNLELLPGVVVEMPRRLAINFHDGPLPRYAGLHATTWALLAGEQEYAVTWHRMATGIDVGEILVQEPVAIEPGTDTALTLNTKCYEAGMRSFARLLDDLEADRVQQRPQDLTQRSYFARYKRPAGGGSIDWTQSAATIAALIRGLDFGHSPNPLSLPKAWHAGAVRTIRGVEVLATATGAGAGTIIEAQPDRIVVATGSSDVAITSIGDADGIASAGPAAVQAGDRFITAAAAETARWTTMLEDLARHEPYWVERLSQARPLDAPAGDDFGPDAAESVGPLALRVPIDQSLKALQQRLHTASPADVLIAVVAIFLARTAVTGRFDVALSAPASESGPTDVTELISPVLPLRIDVDMSGSVDTAAAAIVAELQTLRSRRSYARDVVGRYPMLRKAGTQALPRTWPIQISVAGEAELGTGAGSFQIGVHPEGGSVLWLGGGAAMSAATLRALVHRFELFLSSALNDGEQPLQQVSLLTPAERQHLLVDWNSTAQAYERDRCIHSLFEAQVARTPARTALVFETDAVDYADLNRRANRLARRLRESGVGPDVVVGLATARSIDMVVGALAILKAGGAYLPLDPAYPRERLRMILEDARVPVVLTHELAAATLPATGAQLLCLDCEELEEELLSLADDNLSDLSSSADLAYVIYTSGSTGEPKGVMVQHRNVANFFTAMDGCLRHDPPGVWLAVTSLSFDISVLEIFWTLTRGFEVVLHGDAREAVSAAPRPGASRQPLEFSLSYFASDERAGGENKYRLLMEGARFADAHGFAAVWTPERHFHAFGGLYPNPSVISAALAAITSRISIRAGSVVLPLHHPLRVAEEWAVVDNLSGGRIGVSFASGWHPEDFVLRPEAFADAKQRMLADIEVVRRLWQGERVPFPGPLGEPVPTATLPRPVQPTLPVWITAAGNPETFRAAGQAGTSVLTHLLGQSLTELAGKIRIYRKAWRAAGHPAGGDHVTLMLHTFVGESAADVRALVRTPMKEYLRSSINLIKHYAWSFPAVKTINAAPGAPTGDLFAHLSPEDLDALLEHAFDRYFDSGGLFGTPETCLPMIDQIKDIGVDEIACLIDFGVDEDMVLEGLEHLNRLRALVSTAQAPADDDYSIPAEIERHRVTHFQCTPSLAGVLVRDAGSRHALSMLQHFAVGGEALSPVLAEQLRQAVHGRLTNMYGPTETTVWSAMADIGNEATTVPIGRPVANTRIYVLDAAMQPVPPGFAGEIYIGGEGVARGYLRRPALNAERFVADPFAGTSGARLYRTGDLGRYRADGQLEFLGRIDHQVKIRGHRVELGEIEAALMRHPSVEEAVVIDLEVPDQTSRLAAYITTRSGAAIGTTDLRAFVSERLPEYMVPSHFQVLPALPRTPNGKIDRKALPAPHAGPGVEPAPESQPHTDVEQMVAGIWQDVLHTPRVGLDQNFFDLGGHSLLTMQVLARVRSATGRQLPITDMFRFPTVRSLASHLARGDDPPPPTSIDGPDRGASRREMLSKRRQTRARPD